MSRARVIRQSARSAALVREERRHGHDESGVVKVKEVDGPTEALEIARKAAGGVEVCIGVGPSTIREFLIADLIDSMHIVIVPIVLGRGERL
jgi:dihydrofolate reductase